MAKRRRKRKKKQAEKAEQPAAEVEAEAPEEAEAAEEAEAEAPDEVEPASAAAPDEETAAPDEAAEPEKGAVKSLGDTFRTLGSYLGWSEDPELRDRARRSSRRKNGLLASLEPLLGALILALLVRHFALEAFVIPTGSMATSLLGEHVTLVCQECDVDFKVGSPFGNPEQPQPPMFTGPCPDCASPISVTTTDGMDLDFPCPYCGTEVSPSQLQRVSGAYPVFHPECPSCQALVEAAPARVRGWTGRGYDSSFTSLAKDLVWGDVVGGNKIVVNKTVYLWRDPARWEVVVFKFPDDAYTTYIKRLVGLPGELLRLRNGDLEVDGALVPRPLEIQEAIWVEAGARAAFRDELGSDPWASPDGGFAHIGHDFAVDSLGRAPDEPARLLFEAQILEHNSYNVRSETELPSFLEGPGDYDADARPVGDLRLGASIAPLEGAGGVELVILEVLGRDESSLRERRYRARIPVAEAGPWQLLLDDELVAEVTRAPLPLGEAADLVFWNADDQLVLKHGDDVVFQHVYDGGSGLTHSSRVGLAAWGIKAELDAPTLHRDVQYTDNGSMPEEPLGEGRYFVLGDNSANSLDGRDWGSFSERLLVGKAVAVFWPAHPWDWQMRWIR